MVGWKIKIHKGEEMNIEERLKEVALDDYDSTGILVVTLGKATEICKKALKKQREICAETLRQYIIQYGYSPVVFREIKNAPEPEDL